MYRSKSVIHKAKQPLTKIRRRKLGLETRHAPTKKRKREARREEKPSVVAKVSKIVEAQLLKEVLDGTFLERYYKLPCCTSPNRENREDDDDYGIEYVEEYDSPDEDDVDMFYSGTAACDESLNKEDVKNAEIAFLERYKNLPCTSPNREDDDYYDGIEYVEYLSLSPDEGDEDMYSFGTAACDESLNKEDVKNVEVEDKSGSGERHKGI